MSIHTRFPFLIIEGYHVPRPMILVENSTLHEAEYRIQFLHDLRVVRLYHVPENFDMPKHIKVEVK